MQWALTFHNTKIHNNNKYDASLNLCSLDQIRSEWLAIRVDVGVQFTMFQYNEISNASWRSRSLAQINYNEFSCCIILVM